VTMFSRDELRAAAERLRGYSMNPKLGLGEWYPAHAGSDSPVQDSQRAFLRDLRAVAESVIQQTHPDGYCDACGWPNKPDGCCSRNGCCNCD
jgi:uncharacterized protein involved in type VI secretion and phage assembly